MQALEPPAAQKGLLTIRPLVQAQRPLALASIESRQVPQAVVVDSVYPPEIGEHLQGRQRGQELKQRQGRQAGRAEEAGGAEGSAAGQERSRRRRGTGGLTLVRLTRSSCLISASVGAGGGAGLCRGGGGGGWPVCSSSKKEGETEAWLATGG